jgi:class 3 adenylate cyclase
MRRQFSEPAFGDNAFRTDWLVEQGGIETSVSRETFGDGVNVASRFHVLAPPNGICASEHVYDERRWISSTILRCRRSTTDQRSFSARADSNDP